MTKPRLPMMVPILQALLAKSGLAWIPALPLIHSPLVVPVIQCPW